MSEMTCFCGATFDTETVAWDEVCLICGSFLPGILANTVDRLGFYYAAKHDIEALPAGGNPRGW